jgi:oligoribonuclease (3'-5' exoribonuclease)
MIIMEKRIIRNISLLRFYLNDLEKGLNHNATEDIKESITDAEMTLNHIKELINDNY